MYKHARKGQQGEAIADFKETNQYKTILSFQLYFAKHRYINLSMKMLLISVYFEISANFNVPEIHQTSIQSKFIFKLSVIIMHVVQKMVGSFRYDSSR